MAMQRSDEPKKKRYLIFVDGQRGNTLWATSAEEAAARVQAAMFGDEKVTAEDYQRWLYRECERIAHSVRLAPWVDADPVLKAKTLERVRACFEIACILDELPGATDPSGSSASLKHLENFSSVFGNFVGPNSRYELTGTDSCGLSFGFRICGMVGGLIFHHSCREWSLHT